ncbi:MAG TPA: hypothetical protein VGB14_13815 [Acidimicrobiales bacterium]|jgi:hypothetical protein
MFIALVIVTVVLAVTVAGSAMKKIQKDEQVRTAVGVDERYFPVLAGLEVAGAAGILGCGSRRSASPQPPVSSPTSSEPRSATSASATPTASPCRRSRFSCRPPCSSCDFSPPSHDDPASDVLRSPRRRPVATAERPDAFDLEPVLPS